MDKSFNLNEIETFPFPNLWLFMNPSPKTIALRPVFDSKKNFISLLIRKKGKQWYERYSFLYLFGCSQKHSAGTHLKKFVCLILF